MSTSKFIRPNGECLNPYGQLVKDLTEKKYTEESESSFQFLKKQLIYREDGALYLDRLIIIRCFLGAIMFHKIYLTDNDCLHDHPWAFLSIILKGGYIEHTKKGSKLYGAGSILYRPALFAHRLEVYQPAYTLVITSRKKRTWGYWTPRGWTRWFNYKTNSRCD